jgi:predicted amidophosphoribosyltransferase
MFFKSSFAPYSCLNCGAAFVQSTRFCRPCFENLFILFEELEPQTFYEHKTVHLLNWIPNTSHSLSRLHLELKNTHPNIWKWLAQKMAKRLIKLNLNIFHSGEPIIVSLKSSPGNNHAESWGSALSQELGLNHIVALQKKEKEGSKYQQKSSNMIERKSLTLQLSVDLTKINNRPLIFADDVLTTGATLREAYRALGQPDHFLGLFISHRKLH